MNPRTLTFAIAATILVALRAWVWIGNRRGRRFFQAAEECQRWNLPQLVIASFLTLFAELSFIRWIAVQVFVLLMSRTWLFCCAS
jgi:hypothetical protein